MDVSRLIHCELNMSMIADNPFPCNEYVCSLPRLHNVWKTVFHSPVCCESTVEKRVE